MKVLVIGATGYIGGTVAQHLSEAGHVVQGLARSDDAAARLQASGIPPVRGDIADAASVVAALSDFDAVIYCAVPAPQDADTLHTVIDALAGSGRTLIYTSGVGLFGTADAGEPTDASYAEEDAFAVYPPLVGRAAIERAVIDSAARGVRSMVVRPPLVHGRGASSALLYMLDLATREGKAYMVGRGQNRWGYVHVDDLAALFVKALEGGAAGAVYHAIADEHEWGAFAALVGELLDVPVATATADEADALFGAPRARLIIGGNARASSEKTRTALGWQPAMPGIADDLLKGSYAGRRVVRHKSPDAGGTTTRPKPFPTS
jgi:nucleoside-diphosphate-sugar epimerase